jgi:hypothetical protein
MKHLVMVFRKLYSGIYKWDYACYVGGDWDTTGVCRFQTYREAADAAIADGYRVYAGWLTEN